MRDATVRPQIAPRRQYIHMLSPEVWSSPALSISLASTRPQPHALRVHLQRSMGTRTCARARTHLVVAF